VAKLPVRQALAAAIIRLPDAGEVARLSGQTGLSYLMMDELNVEAVRIEHDASLETPWTVELDTVITPDLRRKGLRREFARQVMALRKEAKLEPGDRIRLMMSLEEGELREAIEERRAEVLTDVKAIDLSYELPVEETSISISEVEVGGSKFRIAIEKK
jgi:hypothetical protein